MKRKRIGIIGLGNIAQKAYLPVITQQDNVDIVGLMSTTAATVERIGSQYRIPGRYTRLDDLLRLEPDAVFVHSPTETHYEIVTECLSRDIHVYVDKPLSYRIHESEQMAEIAIEHNKLLCVGFNRRFAPLYRQAKAWMEEAGGFDLCIAQKHRTKQQSQEAKLTLYDDLIHMLDLLLWLGADAHELKSSSCLEDSQGKLLHASGSLSFGTMSKASGFYSMNRQAGADLEKVELHGGGRSAEIVNLESAVFYDRQVGQRIQSFGSWDSILYRRGFVGVVEHFMHTMDEPEGCELRADSVMGTHLLVEKLCV